MEEINMLHPEYIMYAVIASGIVLFAWKKRKKFKKGVIVANTKYVKKIDYYKALLAKYRIYNILIKIVCIVAIIISSVLSARIVETKKEEETTYNRDIMLCMDISPSVHTSNEKIIEAMKTTIKSLNEDRIGIQVFNGLPLSLSPLTTDYNYLDSILDDVRDTIKNYRQNYQNNKHKEAFELDLIKATSSDRGASLIGDGLASCALAFKKDDERTKTIIFVTDNELSGSQYITLQQAAQFAKERKIKVYAVGTEKMNDTHKTDLKNAAELTEGKYFDLSGDSAKNIVNEVNNLNKSIIKTTSIVKSRDLPEYTYIYLLIAVCLLLLLDWRVRI